MMLEAEHVSVAFCGLLIYSTSIFHGVSASVPRSAVRSPRSLFGVCPTRPGAAYVAVMSEAPSSRSEGSTPTEARSPSP